MRIRIDAIIETALDEGDVAEVAECALEEAFYVEDLVVYEVCYVPSFAEEARARLQRNG